MSTSYEIFAAVTPGLELALAEELAELAPDATLHQRRGGVELRGAREVLWTVCAGSRLAETVRVRIGRFEARDFGALEAGLARLPWAAYLARDASVDIQVTARKSALYHSGAVAERVDRALKRPLAAQEEGGTRIWIRLVKDRATVSVDAGGGLLHRRGWRRAVTRAPLRETLAAACVRLATLASEQPVWDPFCGAGTVAIEAVLASRGGPAQRDRDHAHRRWPTHDGDAYAAWRGEALAARASVRRAIGSDVAAAAITAAEANAVSADVVSSCTWLAGDFEALLEAIPEGAAIVSNPPYGKRLAGGSALERVFTRFGELLTRRQDLGPVVLLVGARGFEAATGLSWRTIAEFSNRGTPTRLLRLER